MIRPGQTVEADDEDASTITLCGLTDDIGEAVCIVSDDGRRWIGMVDEDGVVMLTRDDLVADW